MPRDLKRGKKYVIEVSHKFEGEFVEIIWEGGVDYAIFSTAGTNRYGPNIRKVRVDSINSSELTKT